MNISTHPSTDELGQYLVGSSDCDYSIDQHLEDCPTCRHQLDTLSAGHDDFDVRLKAIHATATIDLSFSKNTARTSLFRISTNDMDSHSDVQDIEALNVVVDRYALGAEIGRGGMGWVFAGRDKVLDRDLVFKVLQDSDDTKSIERFIAEARICGNLQHPGIVPIYDLGRLDDQRPFFSMRRVEGYTLTQLLRERADYATEQAMFLSILTQVCQTVAYAHSLSVIHRDLKPDNIMVGAFGEVQVMDWGIAKTLDRDVFEKDEWVDVESSVAKPDSTPEKISNATMFGRIMGTPSYMSPEQAQGRIADVDQRSDVFALGAILCEILTGKSPYWDPDHDVNQTLKHAEKGDLSRAFRRLDDRGTDEELVAFCKECLAYKQDDRPRDASCVAAALLDHNESASQRLRQAELSHAIQKTRLAEQSKRRKILALATAAIIALGAALAGGYYFYHLQQMRHENDLMREELNRQRLELTLLQEQDDYDRAMMLSEKHDANDVKTMLNEFRRIAGWASSRVELRRMQRQSSTDLPTVDQEFVRRLLEAHIWSVVNIAPELRLKCMSEAEQCYRSTFAVFVNWESPGEFSVKEATETILVKDPIVREAVVNALDDWLRIIRVIATNNQDRVTTNWILNLVNQLDQNALRHRIRDAVARRDITAIENLARDANMTELPAATTFFLVAGLNQLSSDELAVGLLREARQRVPKTFWLNGRIFDRNENDDATADHEDPATAWNPPPQPDPVEIIPRARSNAKAKQYTVALQQFEWLVVNSARSERFLDETHLFRTLQYWFELSHAYAPAYTKLIDLRDTCQKQIVQGVDLRNSFRVFAAINRILQKEDATVRQFVELDSKDADSARDVFEFAKSSLVKEDRIELILKYLDKDHAFAKFLRVHPGLTAADHAELFDTLLTFIALKARNGYKREAMEMSIDARRIWPDDASNAAVADAVRGILPSRNSR